MIILFMGLVLVSLWVNMWFYEHRVQKIPDSPKTFDFTGYRGEL